MDQGYIHLYTGNGKGKTTAALGLALRSAGAGMKVFIAQFVKGMPYSEFNALKYIPGITLQQYGRDCFIENEPVKEDVEAGRKGLQAVANILLHNQFDLVILDEVCIALYYNLFTINELKDILKKKPGTMEIVMTGRYASPELYDTADLVTEMTEIKHYFKKGIKARKGIEY